VLAGQDLAFPLRAKTFHNRHRRRQSSTYRKKPKLGGAAVSSRKLNAAMRSALGGESIDKDLDETIEENYKRVREKFIVNDCARCGTKKLNHSWSKMDLVSMAKTLEDLGDLVVEAYYWPMLQAHTSFHVMSSRLENVGQIAKLTEEDRFTTAGDTLKLAHKVILDVLRLQAEHFELIELHLARLTCLNDYLDVWLRQSGC
jgi:hypothetical protein